jgi:hypothetical protein
MFKLLKGIIKLFASLLVLAIIAACIAFAAFWYFSGKNPKTVLFPECRATVELPSGNPATFTLTPAQARYAAEIAVIGYGRGLDNQAVTIAIATAVQESKLSNIGYGHADSIGLFQQRPSQGWGSKEEILNPDFAINSFYDALSKIDYDHISVTEAAQEVQKSAYPEAYAAHENLARTFATAYQGGYPKALTCEIGVDGAGLSETLPASAKAAFPKASVTEKTSQTGDSAKSITIDRSILGANGSELDNLTWQAAFWGVSVAKEYGISDVSVSGHRWTSASSAWEDTENDIKPGEIVLS